MPQPDMKDDNHRKEEVNERAARLSALCRNAGAEQVSEHLNRMDSLYLRRYSDKQIARHLDALAGLGPSRRCILLERKLGDLQWELPVAAFDYHGLFSLIAGSLASMGISIEQGAVWMPGESEQFYIELYKNLPEVRRSHVRAD